MTVEYRYAETDQEFQACLDVRKDVFIIGQDVPEDEEIDGRDGEAVHILAENDNQVIGTARIRFLDDIVKIERVAVLNSCRGQGIGRGIMLFIMDKMTEKQEVQTLKLSSQTHAIPFYEALGFYAVGDEYMDAGIPHFDMLKDNENR